jgi:DNA invertase Pin-like site-specific DNA recombinase
MRGKFVKHVLEQARLIDINVPTPTARAKTKEVLALKQEGIGAAAIAKQVGISRASVYRVLGATAGVPAG